MFRFLLNRSSSRLNVLCPRSLRRLSSTDTVWATTCVNTKARSGLWRHTTWQSNTVHQGIHHHRSQKEMTPNSSTRSDPVPCVRRRGNTRLPRSTRSDPSPCVRRRGNTRLPHSTRGSREHVVTAPTFSTRQQVFVKSLESELLTLREQTHNSSSTTQKYPPICRCSKQTLHPHVYLSPVSLSACLEKFFLLTSSMDRCWYRTDCQAPRGTSHFGL